MRIFITSSFLTILLSVSSSSFAQKNDIEKITKEEVLKVFEEFQGGYIGRDSLIIDDFMKLFSEDIVCIGTGSKEFITGIDGVKKLMLLDWKLWFDFRIPLDKMVIRLKQNVAWFAVVGSSGPWRDNKTYEIRFVGSLIKSNGKVQFKQICYSYPAPLKEVEEYDK